MEIKKKEKTLAGLFFRYIACFCGSAAVVTVALLLVFLMLALGGFLLPANYAETVLTENEEEIRSAGESLEEWIPEGCTYGVYDQKGSWLWGSFSGAEREKAWDQYEKDIIYIVGGGYYRFIALENGDVCIVKYYLDMRYSNNRLNHFLPGPEALMPLLDVLLMFGVVLLLSRSFAKKLKLQLQKLSAITEKIAENDLEFETKTSEIREINEVMQSFGRMKDALQDSLQKQWDMEKQRQEQLSALAHDIKTPLTIIRGNGELLEEGELPEEERECAGYILASVKEIEQYLENMRRVLQGRANAAEQKVMSCINVEKLFRDAAKQLSAAEKIPVAFEIEPCHGEICGCEENILRAWQNIVSNGAERTDRRRGIDVFIRHTQRDGLHYLKASVRDYGPGFSERDLRHAEEEFYSGDVSRHGRHHQGLGLAIAKSFMEAQGGFLEYGNHSSGTGAEVSLWIKVESGQKI